jgi:predicted PurR-regulated permease PerM
MDTPSRCEIAAWTLMALALWLVFPLRLFSALFAGFLVHELVQLSVPVLRITRISGRTARLAAVGLIAALIVAGLVFLGWKIVLFLRSEGVSLPSLLDKLAGILEGARDKLPQWLGGNLPDNVEALSQWGVTLLRQHASSMQEAGKGVGLTLAHVVIGMVLGAIISLREMPENLPPLAAALAGRVQGLGLAFRSVVFAQVRISAINTVLTACFLALALPAFGIHFPLVKSMICLTFLAGLLPVVGNLISNGVILIVSVGVSFPVAVSALAFLVAIHKLEYFLNARIIGGHIHARTWELLAAMLVMEAAFGLPGLVAAPIYYAYVKKELGDRGLV